MLGRTGRRKGYARHTVDWLTLEALDTCVRAGKVRYVGLCNLLAWEIAKSLWISDKRGLAQTSVIIGARTREQLADNITASALELSPEELGALNQVSELPPEYPGWMLAFQPQDRLGVVE